MASVLPGNENNYSAPFIKATNIALSCLEEIKVDGMRAASGNVNMIFQQNDVVMVQDDQDEESTRRPDVIILPWEKSYDDDNVSATDHRVIKATMAPKARLAWQDVLASVEFWRQTRWPLQPVPDAPATAASGSSQTRAGRPAPVPPSKQ